MPRVALLSAFEVFAKLIDIAEISELEFSCKQLLEPYFDDVLSFTSKGAIVKIQAVLDYMHEKINVGSWKDVRLYVRKTITVASYFKLLVYTLSKDDSEDTFFKKAYKIIDHGIMFGCPLDAAPTLLQNCASLLNETCPSTARLEGSSKKLREPTADDDAKGCEIDVLHRPSLERFYRDYILKEKPAILRNCIGDWPASTKWQDIQYLIKVAGLRTVPVEVGSSYTDRQWTQTLMTVKDFINEYILQESDKKGYLAQYELFNQIPELREDITVPEYCFFADSDEEPHINAWFGPKGTVSPLHYDPKRNLLAQVVGDKKIILFAPSDSEYLYPHGDDMLSNTARVDPSRPDLTDYPLFQSARPLNCLLKTGDMLYIPPKWWHYVESLSVSFSVSFWWL